MCEPLEFALDSAALRLARTSDSSSSAARPGQRPGRNVEFDVVGAQFGLVGRIGDRGEHFLVAHRGLIVGVDEVALDLHAGQRTLELEAGPGQHRLEDVKAQLHLAPVFAAVRATEVGLLHLFAHKADATGSMTRAQGNRAYPPLAGTFGHLCRQILSTGESANDRIRTHHCAAGTGRARSSARARRRTTSAGQSPPCCSSGRCRSRRSSTRSTSIRCGRRETLQARSTPPTGFADSVSSRCGLPGGLLLLVRHLLRRSS